LLAVQDIHRRWSLLERQFAFMCCVCALLFVPVACGQKGAKTYPVSGKVEVKDGDTSLLTGSHIELMQEADSVIRPNGKITSSGGFSLQTLLGGKVASGAPEGKYKVRIILGDESDEGVPKRKGDPINKRYYDFATSGLTMTVPGGDYNVSLSKK
jgi:hypothetical protein